MDYAPSPSQFFHYRSSLLLPFLLTSIQPFLPLILTALPPLHPLHLQKTMVAAKLKLLMAIGVALSIVQAGPIDNNYGSNGSSLNNKVLLSLTLLPS